MKTVEISARVDANENEITAIEQAMRKALGPTFATIAIDRDVLKEKILHIEKERQELAFFVAAKTEVHPVVRSIMVANSARIKTWEQFAKWKKYARSCVRQKAMQWDYATWGSAAV